MRPAVVACPAKINTFLSVGPPEDSGYHPIRTVFRAVALCDFLHITENAAQDHITCDWPDLPHQNTLTKTLRLARELLPIPPLRIHIEKRIPSQAGLGGGSADAGGLLRWIGRQFESAFPIHSQMEIASAVGADVPFAASGWPAALGQGFGGDLTEVDANPSQSLVLAKPSEGTATAGAYARLDAIARPWKEFPGDLWEPYNDFERVASCDSLDLIDQALSWGAATAGLSGSGSAIWAQAPDAESFAARFEAQGHWSVATTTLTKESPQWTF